MELEILQNTKMLLGFSSAGASEAENTERDGLLMFLIKDTIDAVIKYCRIEILPRQLYGLIAQITAELYRSRSYGDDVRAVKSLTEGERRVEFEDKSDVFASFGERLEPFINKAARLPSQLEARNE